MENFKEPIKQCVAGALIYVAGISSGGNIYMYNVNGEVGIGLEPLVSIRAMTLSGNKPSLFGERAVSFAEVLSTGHAELLKD